MLNKSDEIKNISKALMDFQTEISTIAKDSTNPFFKNKYASLPTILTAIKEPLQKCELVFSQFPVGENELSTIVVHTPSGEYFEGTYKMTPAKNDPQGQGSVITYQRRYALAAILGLNIDVDDDGNKASTPTPVSNTTNNLPPKSTSVNFCPIHKQKFVEKKSTNGTVFYGCPEPGCNQSIK